MSKRKRLRAAETVMLTPMDLSEAKAVGSRTFRKQILPLATITYRGRKIKFDRPFLQSVKDAFDKKAYDQVPLVLANEDNAHHMDPERFTGDVQALELTESGLDAIIHTTRRGARVIRENPKVGVSVRIKSNVEKADGRFFDRALNHVLVTMDPKVTGMTPWQTVDLSTDSTTTEVVDLTAAHYTEGNTMATKIKAKGGQPQSSVISIPVGKKGKTKEIDLSTLSDEDFQALLDLATDDGDGSDDDVIDFTDDLDDEDEDEDESDDDEDDDEDLEDEEDEEDDEDEEDEDAEDLSNPFVKKGKKGKAPEADADEDVKANLTGKGKKAGKVPPAFGKRSKKKKASDAESRLVSLSNAIAKKDWQRERRAYVLAGVPPHLLDLAEPVLSTADDLSIDLSEGDESIDVAGIVRDMLDASKGYIESKPEVGHQIDLSEGDETEAEALAKAWDAEYGTV